MGERELPRGTRGPRSPTSRTRGRVLLHDLVVRGLDPPVAEEEVSARPMEHSGRVARVERYAAVVLVGPPADELRRRPPERADDRREITLRATRSYQAMAELGEPHEPDRPEHPDRECQTRAREARREQGRASEEKDEHCEVADEPQASLDHGERHVWMSDEVVAIDTVEQRDERGQELRGALPGSNEPRNERDTDAEHDPRGDAG